MFILGFEIYHCVKGETFALLISQTNLMCLRLLSPESRELNTINVGLALTEITFHRTLNKKTHECIYH